MEKKYSKQSKEISKLYIESYIFCIRNKDKFDTNKINYDCNKIANDLIELLKK